MEQTLLPITLLPLVSGLIVIGFGIHKETRYVSGLSIAFTVANVITTFLFTNVNSISFQIWAVISIFGIIVIARDVHKQYKKWYVAFFLGSKSIGSLTFFLGLTENNWIMQIFEPIFRGIINSEQIQTFTDTQVIILVHLTGILIILGVVHAIGRFVGWWRNK